MSAREPSPEERRLSLSPGQRLADRYVIEATLGEGASGIVYLARCDGEPEERVALKVIHRHLCGDRQIYKRFHREAAILKHLEGPQIVRLLDFMEHDGLLMLALEYVHGTSLEALLQEEAPLPPGQAVEIALQVCAALESAHAAGVIHRDLKPGNVLLQRAAPAEDGEDKGPDTVVPARLKVVDFGLAKVVHGEQMSTGLTEQDMIFGTPEYMAPEQVRGDELDARCDIYALGCILYEMAVGTVPFKKRTPIAIMTAHLTEEVPPPRSSRRDGGLSAGLEAVILRALAKRPEDRYESAGAFAEALAACRPEARIVARPGSVTMTELSLRRTAFEHSPTMPGEPPPGAPPSRRAKDVGLAATLPVDSAPPGPKVPRQRPVAPQRRQRMSDRALWIVIAVVFAALGIAIGTLVGRW
jgi:serine/threonine-protein kinase